MQNKKNSGNKKVPICSICDRTDELYQAQCSANSRVECKNEKLLCKSCLIQFQDDKDEYMRCVKCNEKSAWTKKNFARFHHRLDAWWCLKKWVPLTLMPVNVYEWLRKVHVSICGSVANSNVPLDIIWPNWKLFKKCSPNTVTQI